MEEPTLRTTNRKRNRSAQPEREMSGEQHVMTRPAKRAACKKKAPKTTEE